MLDVSSMKNLFFLCIEQLYLDFSRTVKGVTLIFLSGRGSAISSAQQGKSGFIYNLAKVFKNKLFEPRKRACIS